MSLLEFLDKRHANVVSFQPYIPSAFTPGHSAAGRIKSTKNFSGSMGNPTRDLPACSAVPQPTAPPRSPIYSVLRIACCDKMQSWLLLLKKVVNMGTIVKV